MQTCESTPKPVVRAFKKFCANTKIKQQAMEMPSFPEIQGSNGEAAFTTIPGLLGAVNWLRTSTHQ